MKISQLKSKANKNLRTVTVKISQLKSKANKTRDSNNFARYKKQRNFGVKLNKRYKKEHLNYLNPFHDPNIFFEKLTKLIFLSSIPMVNQKLTEKHEIMTKNIKVAHTLNSYFTTVTPFQLFKLPLLT